MHDFFSASNLHLPPRPPPSPGAMTSTMTTAIPSTALPADLSAQIQIHRGAIDQTTITTHPPTSVMQKVHAMLLALGVSVQTESTFRLRCIRPQKTEVNGSNSTDVGSISNDVSVDGDDVESDGSEEVKGNPGKDEEEEEEDPKTPTQAHHPLPPSSPPSPTKPACTLYGPTTSDDPAGEVRFSVELTRLAGLSGTYSLDIRRLKGHLRSYKFIYDTLRDRAELNR